MTARSYSPLTAPPTNRRAPPPVPGLRLPLGRRRLGPGAVASIVLHGALLFLLLYKGTLYLEGGSGPGGGPRGGGGGGGQTLAHFLNLPAYSSPQEVTVPAPPTVTVPPIALPDPVKLDLPQPPPLVQPAMAVLAPAVVGAGQGTGGGPGQGSGSGGGQGGGVGTGIGNDSGPGSGGPGGYIDPAPRRVIPQPPECVGKKGRLVVRFWVTAEGRVDRVELNPSPKKSDCRDEFIDLMKHTQFIPATRLGQPVAGIDSITYTLGH